MYSKEESTKKFCVVMALKEALHHLSHAYNSLEHTEANDKVCHYLREAKDDIEDVINYVRGHDCGKEEAIELIKEALFAMKEHKHDNPGRHYRRF